MDRIHTPHLRQGWISQPLHIEKTMRDYVDTLAHYLPSTSSETFEQNISAVVNSVTAGQVDVSEDLISALADECDVERLDCDDELPVQHLEVTSQMGANNLITIETEMRQRGIPFTALKNLSTAVFNQRHRHDGQAKRHDDQTGSDNLNSQATDSESSDDDDETYGDARHSSRIRNRNWLLSLDPRAEAETKSYLINREPLFVVSVKIYRPIKDFFGSRMNAIASIVDSAENVAENEWLQSEMSRISTRHSFTQNILMLSTHTLAELRDLIRCPLDHMSLVDVSDSIVIYRPSPTRESDEQSTNAGQVRVVVVDNEEPDADVDGLVLHRALDRDCYLNVKDRHVKHYPHLPASHPLNVSGHQPGFFFINGCFYRDMRADDNVAKNDLMDYSTVIRNWTESRRRVRESNAQQTARSFTANQDLTDDLDFGQFTVGDMDEQKIADLELRIGYPYVYVHRGCHEHLVVFDEVRLASRQDFGDANRYPMNRCIQHPKPQLCMVCTHGSKKDSNVLSTRIARWVTTGNSAVPEDPFFFCDICFVDLNFDIEGNKMGQFHAYEYTDWSLI